MSNKKKTKFKFSLTFHSPSYSRLQQSPFQFLILILTKTVRIALKAEFQVLKRGCVHVENDWKKEEKKEKSCGRFSRSCHLSVAPSWSSFFQEQFRFAEIALTFRPPSKKKKFDRPLNSNNRNESLLVRDRCSWLTTCLQRPTLLLFSFFPLFFSPSAPCRWTKSINGGFDTNLMDLLLLRRVLDAAHVCKQPAQYVRYICT